MSETLNILRRVAGDSSLAFFSKLLAALLLFLTNLAMARLYGARTMGTYFIAINLINTVSIFCCLGFETGLLRFTAVLKADGKLGRLGKVLWPALGVAFFLGCLAAASIYGSGSWLAERLHAPNLNAMLAIMVLVLPVAIISLLLCETIRALGGVKWVIIQQYLFVPFVFLILLLILSQASRTMVVQSKFLALAYLSSIFAGLFFLVAWPGAIFRHNGSGQSGPNSTTFSGLLRYSWPIYLGSILWAALYGLDSLVLGWFSSPEDVAYYNIAAKIAPLITFPLLAIEAVVPPLFAQFHQQGDLKGLETVSQATARWMYLVALPLALAVILLAPDLLGLFGQNFTKGRFALSVLAIGQLLYVASGPVYVVLAMTGQQWTIIKILAIISVVIFPFLVLVTAAFGLNGLAVASACGNAGTHLLMSWAVWRRLGLKAFAQKVGRANLGGLLGVGFFYLSAPYLGAWGGAVCFLLAYLTLAAKPIRHEFLEIFQAKGYGEAVSPGYISFPLKNDKL